MGRYVLVRLGGAIAALFVLSVVVFAMVRLVPGSVEDVLFGLDGGSAEARQVVRDQYRLDDALHVQYGAWMARVVQGDLGDSVRGFAGRTQGAGRISVNSIIMDRIRPSLELAGLAMAVSLVGSILLGSIAALRRGRFADRAASTGAVIGMSVPDFVVALLLIIFVARRFEFFSLFGYRPMSAGMVEWFRHLALPALSLALALMGLLTRLTRQAMVTTLTSDWVRTARGKGMSFWRIYRRHILRPSLIPVVTTAGLQMVALFGGIVIIESIFSIPGMGRMILEAISNRDYAVIQGATLLIGAFAILMSVAVDLTYRVLDPRVRAS